MANTVCLSLLVVALATACLSKALSDPHGSEGAGVLRPGTKHLSTSYRAGRAASFSAGGLMPRLVPQGGLAQQAGRYQLRDLHEMKDRDYIGWMDFGRRSAEDYEPDA